MDEDTGDIEDDPKLKAEDELLKISKLTVAHDRTACTFKPIINEIFEIFCPESKLYQQLHAAAHTNENQVANLNLEKQRRRLDRGDGSMLEYELAEKRIVQLMDAEVPSLAKQDYQIMLKLLSSTSKLIACFFELGNSQVEDLQTAHSLSPYMEIMRLLRLPHGGGSTRHF